MKAGTYFNRYVIEKTISDNGGTARIYLAHLADDPKFQVAIKLSRSVGFDKGHEDLLLEREAELLQQPHWRHPGIVRIYPSPIIGGRPQYIMRAIDLPASPYFMVMEYLKGKTLSQNLKEIQKYSLTWKLELFYQILTTISFIHAKGYAHRDLKPDNIVFREPLSRYSNPQTVLIDFALASSGDAELSVVENSYTLSYVPPERILKTLGVPIANDDIQAQDIWSLGVIFYEILTGNYLFKGKKDDIRTTIIHEQLRPNLPNTPEYDILAAFIREMLQKEKEKRPTVDLVIKAMESLFLAPRIPTHN